MSVKVAVRVRPFNQREIELGSQLCVDMVTNTTILKDPKGGADRDYTFDYSFWSHDKFTVNEEGYNQADDERYSDQQMVFEKVGQEILTNAWEGYHCCLFAYGQTGSGKSYSMIGYGANKGIVPISFSEIFKRIQANDNENKRYEVQFSMTEIYNEKLQDLLAPVNARNVAGLKVREHKVYGVYVEGLSKHAVDSYDDIEAKMEQGNRNRTIASTLMNACSSRAHTIISLEFKQIEKIGNKTTQKLSVIHLVDLAGSEKISKTGASGDRLKEGCAINKSLSVLGLVISTLAEKSMGKSKTVVPYRESVLTRILQNALGGNSKTLMICALSPSSDNYEETLSTLRYADQAKKIKCNAVVNENEQDKMIRELKGENERLKEMLAQFGGDAGMMKSMNSAQDEDLMRKIQELEEALRSNGMLITEQEKTHEQKLEESKNKEIVKCNH